MSLELVWSVEDEDVALLDASGWAADGLGALDHLGTLLLYADSVELDSGAQGNAETASGTGTAHDPSTRVTTNAGTAVGTGTAYGATVQEGMVAGEAQGSGQAHGPSIRVTTQAGEATGTGAAHDAAVQRTYEVDLDLDVAFRTGDMDTSVISVETLEAMFALDFDADQARRTSFAEADLGVGIDLDPEAIRLAFAEALAQVGFDLDADAVRLLNADADIAGSFDLDAEAVRVALAEVDIAATIVLEAHAMRIISVEGRCKASPGDERINVLAHALMELAIEAVDCPPWNAAADWVPRYPLRYVSIGKPPLDCSQIVVYVADGPRSLPSRSNAPDGRTSGVVYEVELRVLLSACCAPGPQLQDGSFMLPEPEAQERFARLFNRDIMTLWGELSRIRKEQWGHMGVRRDDPIEVERDSAEEGLCFAAECVVKLPLLPIGKYSEEAMGSVLDYSPRRHDFIGIVAGYDWSSEEIFVAQTLIGDDMDLTGCTVEANVYDLAGNIVTPLTVTIVDEVAGQMTFGLTAAQTQAVGAGRKAWEVHITEPGGRKRMHAWGDYQLVSPLPVGP